MRLRRKLTIAFFVVSSVLSVLLALFLYRFVERQLKTDLRDRLRDIGLMGAHLVDHEAYMRLAAASGDVAAIEQSADYKHLTQQLKAIRGSEPDLIQFSYLLAPTADPDKPRFIADADVLDLVAQNKPDEQISHWNEPYDVSKIPLLKKALTECTRQLEEDFVYDPEFKVNSVSAYMPLTNLAGEPRRDAQGRCLGVLGVDITDRKMRKALDATGALAIQLSLIAIALALFISIAMGTILTRSVLALTTTVKRFAEKDFSARTPALPHDEIGQLANNFNEMAQTIQQHSENLEGLVEQRTSELNAEKQESERLLLNVLPAPIAERLKTGESLIVDRFENVSVLFADLVGFTTHAAKTSPEDLVRMLNELFSAFDKLAEQHGLEKIKTIGDAYMVVAGIPQPVADHGIAIAHMAHDMVTTLQSYAKKMGYELSIRIGIHSGAVVAGVIGTKKFIYDLWGDTVNIASRMESNSLPGRIQVSEATAQLLKGHFELELRGEIDLKGKGKMRAYLLGRQLEDPNLVTIRAITSEA